MHWPEREGGTADPVRRSGAIERDALAGLNLRLAIERRVIGILGDQHVRDYRLGRNALLDRPLRRWRLHHFPRAGCAGVFGTAGHEPHVEPLGHILADAMPEAAEAGAGRPSESGH